MNEIKTRGFFNRRKAAKARKVFKKYLQHKGHEADQYILSYTLFKEPVLFVGGWKIAIERGSFMGKTRIYYSLIA